MARKDRLKQISIAFRDERIPTRVVDLKMSAISGVSSFETPGDIKVPLPGGGEIFVSAEVFPGSTPDVSISVLEGDEITCAVRCTSGVVVSYQTRSGVDVLLQIGTGPWE